MLPETPDPRNGDAELRRQIARALLAFRENPAHHIQALRRSAWQILQHIQKMAIDPIGLRVNPRLTNALDKPFDEFRNMFSICATGWCNDALSPGIQDRLGDQQVDFQRLIETGGKFLAVVPDFHHAVADMLAAGLGDHDYWKAVNDMKNCASRGRSILSELDAACGVKLSLLGCTAFLVLAIIGVFVVIATIGLGVYCLFAK